MSHYNTARCRLSAPLPSHCTLAASCCTPLAVACANVRVHVYRTCESASTDCVACAWCTIACICLQSLSLCIQLCVLVRVRNGMCDVYICLPALCVVCVIAQTRACKSRSPCPLSAVLLPPPTSSDTDLPTQLLRGAERLAGKAQVEVSLLM